MTALETEIDRFARLLHELAPAHRSAQAAAPSRPDLSPAVGAFWGAIGSTSLTAPFVPSASVEEDAAQLRRGLGPWLERAPVRARWGVDDVLAHAALAGRVRLVEQVDTRALLVDDSTGDDPKLFAIAADAPERVAIAPSYLRWLAHRLVTRGTATGCATISGDRTPEAPSLPLLLPELGPHGDGVWLLAGNIPPKLGRRDATPLVFGTLASYVDHVLGTDARADYGKPFGAAVDVVLGKRSPALDPRGSTLAAGLEAFTSVGPGRPKPPLDKNAIGRIDGFAVWVTPLAEARNVRVACERDAMAAVQELLAGSGAEILQATVHNKTLAPAW